MFLAPARTRWPPALGAGHPRGGSPKEALGSPRHGSVRDGHRSSNQVLSSNDEVEQIESLYFPF